MLSGETNVHDMKIYETIRPGQTYFRGRSTGGNRGAAGMTDGCGRFRQYFFPPGFYA
jgi:hypothetical protein